MGNNPLMTEVTEKIVRHSEISRYLTDLKRKLMRMLKRPNKKFDIVTV